MITEMGRITFKGGWLTVKEEPGKTVVRVYGIADRTSQSGNAGDGTPVIIEIRAK